MRTSYYEWCHRLESSAKVEFKFVVTRPFVKYYIILMLTNLNTAPESIVLLLQLLLHLQLHLPKIGEIDTQIESI
jgi:hypothetical protein